MKRLTVLDEIVLFLINKYNGERTIQGIFYLLKGKQSAQIIQDSHFYQVTPFFGLYPNLSNQDLEVILKELAGLSFIVSIDNNVFKVNEKGYSYLQTNNLLFQSFRYVNGLRFNQAQKVFWKRFSLFFQTIANVNNQIKYFRPVQQEQDIIDWVKNEILSFNGTKSDLTNVFYNELYSILKQMNDVDANIFVRKLSGASSYGMTLQQISFESKIEEDILFLQTINVIHQFLFILVENEAKYPILKRFLIGTNSTNVTNTSMETKRLLLEGKSIQEIAVIRNLKISTIEDHIVECVLQDQNLSISDFIQDDQFKKIKEIIKELNTRKLKTIREALVNEVSYFQIRLTLARIGE